ncbi:MAG TPA: hypothetical protein DCE42_05990 [Myxococcales bacterium]|nr:hypothetical protein [Deltaproteobacteria bacterium]MBU51272.1 hypothetical protein [Deltaproteobacteria bacterium]HAA54284.1 hypothetical protein [Myxococcales bacterium]
MYQSTLSQSLGVCVRLNRSSSGGLFLFLCVSIFSTKNHTHMQKSSFYITSFFVPKNFFVFQNVIFLLFFLLIHPLFALRTSPPTDTLSCSHCEHTKKITSQDRPLF